VLARLRNLSRTLTASPFPHRSWEEAQRVSLLLRMLFYGSAISPIILTLHYVTGTYVPVISYEADMFIASLSWAGLYLLARTRYPRIALYASSLLTILILLSAYLHGNSWALFYFVPALVATAFMVPPLPVALIASGYLGMTLWLSKGSDAFPIAPLIILVTASIALIISQHLQKSYTAYQQELASYDHHFRKLLQENYNGLLILHNEKIESADHRFATLVRTSLERLQGAHIRKFLAYDFSNAPEADKETVETLLKLSDGSILHVEVLRTWLQDGRQLLAIRDITPRKEIEAELRFQALHDEVTGLPNRRHLMRILPLYYQNRQPFAHASLLFIDVDDFKKVNDSAGHSAGDALLKIVAKRLQRAVRRGDFVARYAGDEFVVIANIPSGETSHLLERIRNNLHKPYTIENQEFHLTVSIGVVPDVLEFKNYEELIRQADQAMYQAKRAGKARIVYISSRRQIHIDR
jgi:diguanylate cyclase (GGDEF)-like protein